MCESQMARPVTAWPSLGKGSWHAPSAKLVAICLLGSCVVLLLPIAGTVAAGRHAATSHSGAVAGTGRSAGARLQVGRAHVSGRREFRRSAVSRTLARHRDQRAAKHARRHGHPSPRSVPAEVSGQSLSSIPHRTQSMPEGQLLPPPVPRQILVLLDQDQPQALGRVLAHTYRLDRISSAPVPLLGARAELMRVREERSLDAVLAALQGDTRVRSAQPNQRYLQTGGASSRYLQSAEAQRPSSEQSNRRRPDPPIPQYGPRKLRLPEAHQLARGRNVVIAVIDSAVDTGHPDLQDAVSRSFNAAGRPDGMPDYHGTAVAGIIRSHGLVEGAAPESKILAVRAFRAGGERAFPETTTHILITAVDWAVRNGARVLNMSFIGSHDPALQQVLHAANQKGVVVVAAAGNGGPGAPPVYPGAYRGVIAVTAVDEADRRYEHANRGSYVAVAAPGVDILAPVERGGYAYVSGTSFAAAYVSGIAALLLERDPNLDPKSVADLLATAAEDLGPVGRDDDFGAGRVDAYASLKLLAHDLAAKRGELAQP